VAKYLLQIMKYIKKYKKFFEDGVACVNASTTGGAGPVSNAVVGSTPSIGAESGSGDVSSYLITKNSEKGKPSEVSDARFLDDVDDEITRVDDLK
jgi:hypothetical protein